jgi:hypothetical protein
MVFIDVIGLVGSVCLIGIRYPQYVLFAAMIHVAGLILAGLFIHGQIDYIVVAGVFSTASFNKNHTGIIYDLIGFGGTVANYIAASLLGGISREKTSQLLNPLAVLHSPLATVNMRMAFISLLVNLFNIFYGV